MFYRYNLPAKNSNSEYTKFYKNALEYKQMD